MNINTNRHEIRHRTISTIVPTCPFCGEEDGEYVCEISFGDLEKEISEVSECPSCSEKYLVHRSVGILYDTEPFVS